MTGIYQKPLLWVSDQPFQSANWPVLSTTYRVEWSSVRGLLSPSSAASPAALVLEFPARGWHRGELLEKIRQLHGATPVLVYDPQASLSDAVRLARLGAADFLTHDAEAATLIARTLGEQQTADLVRLGEHVRNEEWEQLLIGDSHEMRQVRHIIRVVGGRRSTVLVTGETGTGKELAARALHLAGPRGKGPWVAVNCSALPDNLLEAELFGHVKGAFTGAIQNRAGRFEEAQGGTLLLDEIGELALPLQAKLLRVVQERELQRLGSSETVRLDIRLVTATNCDLAQRVEQELFREDLYYRLNVVPLRMPSLRQRRGDIPSLATHFVRKICHAEAISLKRIAADAADLLSHYLWPGNVRQLENSVEMAVALSGDRPVLDATDFPLPTPVRALSIVPSAGPLVSVPDSGMDYEQTLAVIERSILQQALEKTGGNKKAAADMLRLKRTTLSAKVRSLSPAVCN